MAADFIICSDGGCGPDYGAAAAIVRKPGGPGAKTAALLDSVDSYSAELAGGILGFENLRAETSGSVIWFCDHLEVIKTAASIYRTAQIPKDLHAAELWRKLAELTSKFEVEVRSPMTGEWSARAMSDHKRCDHACCWIQRSGVKLLEQFGPGPVGSVSRHSPAQAWILHDWRGMFKTA